MKIKDQGKTMNFLNLQRLKLNFLCCLLLASSAVQAQIPQAQTNNFQTFNTSSKPTTDTISNHIVVVVNRDLITFEELKAAIEQTKIRIKQANTTTPSLEQLTEQTIEALIFQKIQTQEADLLGVNPTDEMLMEAIKNIAQQNRLSETAFLQQVAKDGLSYDQLKQMIRQDIITRRLRQREIDSKINISNVEIDQYLQKKMQDKPLEYNLDQILIAVPEKASSQDILLLQQKAAAIRADLAQGTDFFSLAKKDSQDDQAKDGGKMGWRTLRQLPSLFIETIAALKEGEISPVIRSPRGFHIIRLNEIRLPKLDNSQQLAEMFAPVPQIKVRHILIRANNFLTQESVVKKLEGIRTKIQTKQSSFGEMAKLFSQDESATKDGVLDWAVEGDFVPEFEAAIANLPLNVVSQPVKTPYGWHLIEVLERKKESLPISRIRDIAKQQLREEKAEELFAKWMDELRDQAVIERRYDVDQLVKQLK
jgi:peptidyl-prolyl cis-trans isomerase SurA